MSSFDLLILLLLAISAFRAYQKGFIVEICSLIAIVIIIVFGMKIAVIFSGYIQQWVTDSRWIPFISYLSAIVCIYFLVRWLGKMLQSGLQLAQLGFVNRFMGAMMGVFKVLFVISLFYWLGNQMDLIPLSYKHDSIFYDTFKNFASLTIDKVSGFIPYFKNLLHDSESLFRTHQASA